MPPRTRAPRLAPERRRPLILDAALGLIAERGYAAVSMDALAAAAGVTKPVLYASFGSKEELFAALVDREEERILGLVTRAVEFAGPAGGADREATVRAGLEATFAALREAPDSFRLVYLAPHGGDAVVRERSELGRRRVEEQIAAQVRERLADPLDAALVARLTVAAGEIGLRMLLEEPGRTDPGRLAARLARLLTRGEQGLDGPA